MVPSQHLQRKDVSRPRLVSTLSASCKTNCSQNGKDYLSIWYIHTREHTHFYSSYKLTECTKHCCRYGHHAPNRPVGPIVSRFHEIPRSPAAESMHTFCTQFDTNQAQALKQTILDEAAGTSNGLKASQQQRDAISQAVNGLVALNPTKDITTSELATGKLLPCFAAYLELSEFG